MERQLGVTLLAALVVRVVGEARCFSRPYGVRGAVDGFNDGTGQIGNYTKGNCYSY